MPNEVDSAVGALDDGLDDVDLPFDRNVVRRPALFGFAITEQARCHRPKAISQQRDHTTPHCSGTPRAGHEKNCRPRSLLAVVYPSGSIFDHGRPRTWT